MGGLPGLLRAVATARSSGELTGRVMDRVGATLGCDFVGLYRFDEGPGAPTEIHVRHLPEAFVLKYEQMGRDEDQVLARVLATRAAAYDEQAFGGVDGWRSSALYRQLGPSYKVRHYLCAPIVVADAVVGTLNIGRASDQARFDRRSCARAAAVAGAIAGRLLGLADDDETGDAALLRLGKLRAERALLRTRLEQVAAAGQPRSDADALAAWRALARREATAVDSFDRGDRRYLLVALDAPPRPAARLTARERDVVLRAADGAMNKVIAADLGLRVSTVATHLSSARAKLGVRSRAELIAAAQRWP